MLTSIIERLRDKRILIAGFGREGRSSLRFMQKYLPDTEVAVADKNEMSLKEIDKNKYHVYYGDEYLSSAHHYDIVIKTPGIAMNADDVAPAVISSQTDLFIEAFHSQIIGITGTKGKSTTTSLIYHLLKNTYHNVVIAGNIGIPVFDCIDSIDDKTIIVYELSAHQLQYITRSPHVGVLLNVFEEHLDHFITFENYKKAKLNVMRLMSDNDTAVVNSVFEDETNDNVNNIFFDRNDVPLDLEALPLKGEHNILNIKAALCACQSMGISLDAMMPHLYTFQPLDHRLQFLGIYGGVKFYNDSISTIPQATIAALMTLPKVDFLLLGGYDRGIDYSPLAEYLATNPVANVMITGEAGSSINNALELVSYKGNIISYNSMEEAFAVMKSMARKDDVCLLSPAAASYDRYKNFEERGDKFKELTMKFNID